MSERPVHAVADEPARTFLVAELVAVGSELTAGETRDTNTAELAAALTGLGVDVVRIQAVPDDLPLVVGALRSALERADLVVSTGGLGPTPDDLTREAIAALCGETPGVDPTLEAWLRGLWERRGMPFPELNLKQAWLIPSAAALGNGHGTAPGWWVDRPDGRVVVALPGPPREMRPMWKSEVMPRLRDRGVGRPVAIRTLRLAGIGESQLAELLGDELLRGRNPSVSTYARADAVDVRIAALDENGRSGAALADATERRIRSLAGDHVWATGSTTWNEAIGRELAANGWTLAATERGTGGSLAALFEAAPWFRLGEVRSTAAPVDPTSEADRVRTAGPADVGIAVEASPRGDDTAVTVAVETPVGSHRERRLAFLRGEQGRSRAAILAGWVLLRALRSDGATASPPATGVDPAVLTEVPQ